LLRSRISSYVCEILRIIDGAWRSVNGIWNNINGIVRSIDGAFNIVSRTLRSVNRTFRNASVDFLRMLAYITEHHHLVIHKFWWMFFPS
jgi:phage-related protein